MYHYTNLEAIHNILSSGKLHFTHILFLNDKSELLSGVDFFKDSIVDTQGKFEEKNRNLEIDEILESFLTTASDNLNDLSKHEINIYVMSFCNKVDLLSQWRGYGNFAIQFDYEKLSQDENLYLGSCLYDENTKHRAVGETLISHAGYIESQKSTNLREDEIIHDGLNHLYLEIVKQAIFFKHAGFSEEDEIRAATFRGTKGYKVKNNMLIPYTEINLDLNTIKSLVIGPIEEQELVKSSLEGFVDLLVKEGKLEKKIKVEVSKLPYRGN